LEGISKEFKMIKTKYITDDGKEFTTFNDAETHELKSKVIKDGQSKATKDIAKLVKLASDSLKEAEQIAKIWKLEFDFNPAYGMGGTFYGYEEGSDDAGWHASSEQNC
jgi:hypothetical protein